VRLVAALASADGELHERELGLLARDWLRSGFDSPADLLHLQRLLAETAVDLRREGVNAVVAASTASLRSALDRRRALRLAALAVAADGTVDPAELAPFVFLGTSLGEPTSRLRDAFATAAALYARLPGPRPTTARPEGA